MVWFQQVISRSQEIIWHGLKKEMSILQPHLASQVPFRTIIVNYVFVSLTSFFTGRAKFHFYASLERTEFRAQAAVWLNGTNRWQLLCSGLGLAVLMEKTWLLLLQSFDLVSDWRCGDFWGIASGAGSALGGAQNLMALLCANGRLWPSQQHECPFWSQQWHTTGDGGLGAVSGKSRSLGIIWALRGRGFLGLKLLMEHRYPRDTIMRSERW